MRNERSWNRNRRLVKGFIAIMAVALAVAAASTSSHADGTMPSAGRAVSAADYGCFSLYFSSMTNACGSMKTLEIPTTVRRSGNFNVQVTAYGATLSNNVGCIAHGIDKTRTAIYGGPKKYLTTFGSPQDIALTTYVPDYGGMYVACDVNPGGRVHVVHWW